MPGIIEKGDLLAELSALEEQARQHAPELLPRLQAMRETGEVTRHQLANLHNQMRLRRLAKAIRNVKKS